VVDVGRCRVVLCVLQYQSKSAACGVLMQDSTNAPACGRCWGLPGSPLCSSWRPLLQRRGCWRRSRSYPTPAAPQTCSTCRPRPARVCLVRAESQQGLMQIALLSHASRPPNLFHLPSSPCDWKNKCSGWSCSAGCTLQYAQRWLMPCLTPHPAAQACTSLPHATVPRAALPLITHTHLVVRAAVGCCPTGPLPALPLHSPSSKAH